MIMIGVHAKHFTAHTIHPWVKLTPTGQPGSTVTRARPLK